MKNISRLTVVVVILSVFALSFTESNISTKEVKAKEIVNLSETNFSEFTKNGVVLVDFWAVWCAPCRLQNPILEDLNKELGENEFIGKVDVDKNRVLANTYGISAIPTILVFKNGVVVERLMGLKQKEELKTVLKKHNS